MAAAPPPPQLMEELVEEILLRFPPDDSASLLRAALVCKLWRRLVFGAEFRRRFLEFHRSAVPSLSVFYTDDGKVDGDADDRNSCWDAVRILQMPMAYFVPTTSFRPAPARAAAAGQFGSWRAIDARHGRVLVCRSDPSIHGRDKLSVWDTVTDEERELPAPPFYLAGYSWNAAVACAAAGRNGNCDHLDCHQGPFLVVMVDTERYFMGLSVYSSEAVAWSKVTWKFHVRPTPNFASILKPGPGVLVRSAFYFLVRFRNEIVEYDMATRQVSTLRLPYRDRRRLKRSIVLINGDDGGLGFVANVRDKLKLWSRVAGADGDAAFVVTRVIDLQKVLPCGAPIKNSTLVNGFAYDGASRVVFIRMSDGLYTIEINSSQVRKLWRQGCCSLHKLLHSNLLGPALGCASRDDKPRAGCASASKPQVGFCIDLSPHGLFE